MCRRFLYTVCMSDDTKSVRLDMRISPEDKDLFQRAAEKDGRSMSNWIRERLLKAAREELKEDGQGRGKRSPSR
jgi:uncharacterized protein (DUF1778 family)